MTASGQWPTLDRGSRLASVTDASGRARSTTARMVLPLHIAALYADRVLPALGTGSRSDPKVIRALRTLVAR